jgi:uncharacterized membrane protein YqjE
MVERERSFSEVLQDIVGNVQEIVRSEVRLAVTEIREEVAKAKSSALLLGAGAVTGCFAILFLLYAAATLLSLIMPLWAALLVVAIVLAFIASVMAMWGMKSLKQLHPAPARTLETIKENVEWVRQRTK